MQSKPLPDGSNCSVLGFGCGAVMGRVGRRQSLQAMGAAWDAGINLYDTARSYGYGESEGVLGEFLAGRRDRVLVSTKYGIEPGKRQHWKQWLRPVARRVLQVVPQARQAVRRQAASQIVAAPLTPQAMQHSLHASLSQLRTDYVDFFFLHDVPQQAVTRDDLFATLELLQQQGKLRWYGVSSTCDVAASALQQRPGVQAVQMPWNLSTLGAASQIAENVGPGAGKVLLANNLFGGVAGAADCQKRLLQLSQDVTLPTEVRDKILACGNNLMAEVMLPMVLQPMVLQHGGATAAIVSMMHESNLAANVAAVSQQRWSPAELRELFKRLAQ